MICRQSAKAPAAQFKSRPQSANPRERIHLDYAGPFFGKMWLICVDSFSKYPYVTMLNVGQTTSNHIVDALQQIFSFEGLPNTNVTDNGPQFVSNVFEEFCANLNIKHLTLPIFHPPSNGEAERFVQTFKRSLEKNIQGGKFLIEAVHFVLATYRSSPHPSLDWRTPAEVLHGRQPKSLMSLFLPCVNDKSDNDCKEKRSSKFFVGDLVFARNYVTGPKWFNTVVTKNVGSMIYMVRTDRGLWKRHQNQLQPRFCDISLTDSTVVQNNSRNDVDMPCTQNYRPTTASDVSSSNSNNTSTPVNVPTSSNSTSRFPSRNRKAPDFYQAGFS